MKKVTGLEWNVSFSIYTRQFVKSVSYYTNYQEPEYLHSFLVLLGHFFDIFF